MVPNTMVNTSKVKRMVLACSPGLTEALITANLSKTISKAKEPTIGLMGDNTKATGRIIRWKATEFSLGPMEENIKVNTLMIKKKVKESSFGLMEGNTMVAGRMVNNMV